MKTSDILKRAAALSAAAALLSSCSLQNDTHRTINAPKTLSVSWWGSDTRAEYTFEALDIFEERHDNVIIRPSTGDFSGYKEMLDALYSCGKESDIIQINYSWLSEYSPEGDGFYNLYDLSDHIALENFTESELSYGTINGKLNAVPISLNAPTFYYNADLFRKYGLDIPKTWDDLFACAEVFSADGIYTLETADIYYWLMLTAHEEQISGKAVFDESGSPGFDRENIISMMEFYKLLIDKNVINSTEYDRNDFFEGRSASQLLWVSDASYFVDPIKENGGSVAVGDYILQEGCQRSGWYVKPTSLLAISKNTDDPTLAASLLDFMLNDASAAKLQGTEKGVPLSKSALETLEANQMLSGTSYDASRKISESDILSLIPYRLEETDLYKAFFSEFELYYYEKQSIDESADAFMKIYMQ
ncbi:MAG: ABC transporter substrate-binding protein [Oscillospiraceae bacterium]